jgi:uncharacterized protein (DUF58 family)
MRSNRVLLLAGLAFVFLIVAFLKQDWTIAVLIIPIATVALASAIERFPEDLPLKIRRHVEPRRTVGAEDVIVTVSVTNVGGQAIGNLLIEDLVSPNVIATEGVHSLQCDLKPNETAVVAYKFRTNERGFYTVGPVYARSEDLNGLRFAETSLGSTETVAAFPSIQHIPSADIRPRRVGPWPGLVPSRRVGVGSEFYGVRPYVSGDELRRINWKAFARSGDLVTNEFEGEQVTDVAIVVDTTGSADVFESNFVEDSVSIAASLAALLLRTGNRVGLLIHGEHRAWVRPAFGKKHLLQILYQLAGVRAGRGILTLSYVIESLAPVMLPSRSQVILISPLLDADVASIVKSLAVEGYSVLVLTPRFLSEQMGESEEQRLARRILSVERSNILAYTRQLASVIELGPGVPLGIALRRIRRWRPYLKA